MEEIIVNDHIKDDPSSEENIRTRRSSIMVQVENKQNAIKFFQDEIKQYKIMLNGVIDNNYRTYLEKITMYYELAISALNGE